MRLSYYTHMHTHTCICTHTEACMHIHLETKGWCWVSSSIFFHFNFYFLERISLWIWSWPLGQTGWPAKPRNTLISSFPVPELQELHTTFLHGYLDLKSGLHACRARSLSSVPFPRSQYFLFCTNIFVCVCVCMSMSVSVCLCVCLGVR